MRKMNYIFIYFFFQKFCEIFINKSNLSYTTGDNLPLTTIVKVIF